MATNKNKSKNIVIKLDNELVKKAKELELDLFKQVKEKLEISYVDNVVQSYQPRATDTEHPYVHTGTFEESIGIEVSDRDDGGKQAEVIIHDVGYTEGKGTTAQVYKWLTEGANGTHEIYGYKQDGNLLFGKNYPTPVHPFEEHTKNDILGFIDSLKSQIETRNKK